MTKYKFILITPQENVISEAVKKTKTLTHLVQESSAFFFVSFLVQCICLWQTNRKNKAVVEYRGEGGNPPSLFVSATHHPHPQPTAPPASASHGAGHAPASAAAH